MPPHTDAHSDTSSSVEDLRSIPYNHAAHYQQIRNLAPAARPLKPGIYCPTPAFFDPITEDIDLDTTALHAVRLANAGMAGIVTQGSNGEAVHLSHEERQLITHTTREALDEAGFHDIPVLVGCGAQSTRETIQLCREASAAGGEYAMVLPPSYYRTLYAGESQLDFFRDVADKSPIPIIIYNFPGAASGIDLDSDAIIKLSKYPNIVGCKLTCGNTGKLGRIANACAPGFMTMAGSCDFTLQSLVVGGKGVIGGLANIAPRTSVETYNLYMEGKVELAQKMQAILARGDWVVIKGGVVATKSALMSHFKYGGYGRKPLPRPTTSQDADVKDEIQELIHLEEFLSKGSREQDVHIGRFKQFPDLVHLEQRLASV
ncbi:aldolase [Ascodesmis nigricans]|uniref:Aldolase n=1 Tax=Ascodesmis nigricans TaxID=341454 RepID=A0A4S2MZI3_9PEZI|nr:aldolase [Ascodesmis nigricans]